jgi:hypothetical protein
MMRRTGLVLVALLGCAVSEPNPGHCFNGAGDAFCFGEHGAAAAFCALGSCRKLVPDGCVEERPERECWSPCGQGQTADENDDCDGIAATGDPSTTTSTSGSPSSTDPITSDATVDPTTTGGGCVQEDCTDPELPVCGAAGICVACSDADVSPTACQDVDATRPVCDGGRCVACTADDIGYCGGVTPVCDVASNTCIACTYHLQCPGSACHIDGGSCLDQVPPLHVDAAQPCGGSGEEDDPFCAIQDAIDSVASGASAVIFVTQGQYDENLVIGDGKAIALLAREDDRPIVIPAGDGATLEIVNPVTRAYVEGLRFQDNNDTHAIRVSGARTVFDRVESVRNLGGGLLVSASGVARVRNSIIGANANDVDTVRVDSAELELLYATVVAGVFTATPTRALACTGTTTVNVRNSFLLATGMQTEVACNGAMVSRTASEALLPGSGNEMLPAFDASWFLNFGSANFRLGDPPEIVHTTARWLTGDPPVDIDGDLRPTRDGDLDAAGADR